jgi:hypothetical protein
MTQRKETQHTLKPMTKSQFLSPLQRRIFLYLAENDPKDKNETVKAIKGHYKSSWMAFNSLEKKGIISKINVKTYRGKEYPCFWLTTAGVFIALVEGANPKTVLTKTLEIYPENKFLQCVIEVSPILGTDMYDIALSAFLNKQKLEQSDISAMLATQLLKDRSMEQIKELIAIMKKYPQQFENLKERKERVLENLKKLESLI